MSNVELTYGEGGLVAAAYYGGYATKDEVARRSAELVEAINASEDYAVAGETYSAAYNDPFTPPWRRRNGGAPSSCREAIDQKGTGVEEESKRKKGVVEEEEASPNKRTRRAGRGRSRVFGAWVVSHPVTRHGLTAGARAAVLPLVRRQRENTAARRRRDEAVVASPSKSQLEPSGGRETSSGGRRPGC